MKKWLISALTLALFSCKPVAEQTINEPASAAMPPAVAASELQSGDLPLAQRFNQVGLQVQSVQPSPVEGLVQVMTDKGLFFSSADGRYLVTGNVLDLENFQQVRGQLVPVSLKEQQMRPVIIDKLAELGPSSIEYKAKDEKYVVYAFTDPTCGYCQKLHSEMAQYNDAGITIRYLAFPRGGLNSESALDMQHLWCSRNQQQAMNFAKTNKRNPPAMCNNPVKMHYELGQSFGINGTPALVLANGQIIPGYQPVAGLLAQLAANDATP